MTILGFTLLLLAPAVSAAEPIAVSPGAPGIARATATACPTFSWATLAEAQGYELILYRVDTSGALEEAQRAKVPAGATSWTPPADQCPSAGSEYAWALRGLTDDGATSWSQPLLFSTPGAPSEDEVSMALETLRRYLDLNPSGEPAAARIPPSPVDTPPVGSDSALAQSEDETLAFAAVPMSTSTVGSVPSPQAVVAPGAFSLNIDGDLDLGGFVFKDEVPFLHTDGGATYGNTAVGLNSLISADPGGGPHGTWGEYNTAVGYSALRNTIAGRVNTAIGSRALQSNSTGNGNVAAGFEALRNNTGGFSNVAVGSRALRANLGGDYNIALGTQAMFANTEGVGNIAIGTNSLQKNTVGANNTAAGIRALRDNETGNQNIAIGFQALYNSVDADHNTAVGSKSLSYNTSGENNTALGYEALLDNDDGDHNTAGGYRALWKNTTGSGNTALGREALRENTTGSYNTAIGFGAGFNATGDNNIRIGRGSYGTGAAEIRIGGAGYQTKTFIEGIDAAAGSTFTTDVCIDAATNQLGPCSLSSARFKEGIEPLEEDLHDRLAALHPVSFRYTEEYAGSGERALHYGFVAEQVAEVFPSLVSLDADGRPQTVRYDLLTPLLLAELRRQEEALAAALAERDQVLAELRRRIERLSKKQRFR